VQKHLHQQQATKSCELETCVLLTPVVHSVSTPHSKAVSLLPDHSLCAQSDTAAI
jgi:hypothetical protein